MMDLTTNQQIGLITLIALFLIVVAFIGYLMIKNDKTINRNPYSAKLPDIPDGYNNFPRKYGYLDEQQLKSRIKTMILTYQGNMEDMLAIKLNFDKLSIRKQSNFLAKDYASFDVITISKNEHHQPIKSAVVYRYPKKSGKGYTWLIEVIQHSTLITERFYLTGIIASKLIYPNGES